MQEIHWLQNFSQKPIVYLNTLVKTLNAWFWGVGKKRRPVEWVQFIYIIQFLNILELNKITEFLRKKA